jgi:hypothetical protein
VTYWNRHSILASNIAFDGRRNIIFKNDTSPIGPASLYGQTIKPGAALFVRLLVLHLLDYVALCKSGVFMSGGDVRGSGMSVLRHLLKRTMWGRNVTLDGSSGDDNFGTGSAKFTH